MNGPLLYLTFFPFSLSSTFPDSATTLHFEFYAENSASKTNAVLMTVVHQPHVDQLGQSPAELMERLLATYSVSLIFKYFYELKSE